MDAGHVTRCKNRLEADRGFNEGRLTYGSLKLTKLTLNSPETGELSEKVPLMTFVCVLAAGIFLKRLEKDTKKRLDSKNNFEKL